MPNKISTRQFLTPIFKRGLYVLAILAFNSSIAQATPAYMVTTLGSLGGTDGMISRATSINNKGQIVGSAATLDNIANHAFLYSGGKMADLGTLGGLSSFANSINDNGQVVGTSVTNNGTTTDYLYSDGLMTDLASFGLKHSYAYAINTNGQIVGQSNSNAFLYSNGTITDLGNLGVNYSYASAINKDGQVVGASLNSSGNVHAFLYSSGVLIDLGGLGEVNSIANDINDSNQIVGSSYSYAADGVYGRAFLYSNGVITDLGTLVTGPTAISSAIAINNVGQIVGISKIYGEAIGRPFLYSQGTLTDLNTLIDPSSGWKITSAVDINDYGQIAANGCDSNGICQALLLTPESLLPEPSMLSLLGLGLSMLLWGGRANLRLFGRPTFD